MTLTNCWLIKAKLVKKQVINIESAAQHSIFVFLESVLQNFQNS